MSQQPGLFDMDERLRRLSDIGDQLEAFGRVIDFEMFRPELDRERLTKAGAMKPGLLPASAEAAVPSLMCTLVLNGQSPAGTAPRLLRAALRFPFAGFRAIALIHWRALRLRLKGASFRPRPLPPAEDLT